MTCDFPMQGYSILVYDQKTEDRSFITNSLAEYQLEIFAIQENCTDFDKVLNNQSKYIDQFHFYELAFGDILCLALNIAIHKIDVFPMLDAVFAKQNLTTSELMEIINNKKIDAQIDFGNRFAELSKNEDITVFYSTIAEAVIVSAKKEIENVCTRLLSLETNGRIHYRDIAENSEKIIPSFGVYISPVSNSTEAIYYFKDFKHVFAYELYTCVKMQKILKRCSNCGKFFLPSYRSDEKYCDNIYKDGKTCKQIGYKIKAQADATLSEYRKAYKTANAWKNRNKATVQNAEMAFEKWHIQAKTKMKQAQQGVISVEDLKIWLSENKCKSYLHK